MIGTSLMALAHLSTILITIKNFYFKKFWYSYQPWIEARTCQKLAQTTFCQDLQEIYANLRLLGWTTLKSSTKKKLFNELILILFTENIHLFE